MTKNILFIFGLLNFLIAFGQVKIGDNPNTINSSAILEIESTNKGLLMPRLTEAQRDAIASPIAGLMIYNSENNCMEYFDGTLWSGCIFGESNNIKNSCLSWLNAGHTTNGIYVIDPDGVGGLAPFNCYCDQTTDGGGWARLDYTSDLAHVRQFTTGDGRKWLPSNFSLTLSDAQINSIRAIATQGKQSYHGTCEGVIHYYYTSGSNYNYSFGFRLHGNLYETNNAVSDYSPVSITISNDGCAANDGTLRSTDFLINDIRVPIINVNSLDNGDSNEKFGSTLTSNPAWLR